MVDIVVKRGAGSAFGSDIVDPLLSDTSAALERGRIELDRNATNGQRETLVTVYRAGVKRGQIIEVQDELQGENWRGVVNAITHNSIGPERTTTLQVVRV